MWESSLRFEHMSIKRTFWPVMPVLTHNLGKTELGGPCFMYFAYFYCAHWLDWLVDSLIQFISILLAIVWTGRYFLDKHNQAFHYTLIVHCM